MGYVLEFDDLIIFRDNSNNIDRKQIVSETQPNKAVVTFPKNCGDPPKWWA